MVKEPRVTAIITAGGVGKRMGTAIPKQFMPLAGMPVLARTIAVFEDAARVQRLILTVPPDWAAFVQAEIIDAYGYQKVAAVITGGSDRQTSVRKGLACVGDADIVLIHDGVRPFVTAAHINGVIDCAAQGFCAVLGVPSKDTVKRVDPDTQAVRETIPRETAWLVQTPQGFTCEMAAYIHAQAAADGFWGTDDAILAERLGLPVRMVLGDYRNIKITTPEDLLIGASFLRS